MSTKKRAKKSAPNHAAKKAAPRTRRYADGRPREGKPRAFRSTPDGKLRPIRSPRIAHGYSFGELAGAPLSGLRGVDGAAWATGDEKLTHADETIATWARIVGEHRRATEAGHAAARRLAEYLGVDLEALYSDPELTLRAMGVTTEVGRSPDGNPIYRSTPDLEGSAMVAEALASNTRVDRLREYVARHLVNSGGTVLSNAAAIAKEVRTETALDAMALCSEPLRDALENEWWSARHDQNPERKRIERQEDGPRVTFIGRAAAIAEVANMLRAVGLAPPEDASLEVKIAHALRIRSVRDLATDERYGKRCASFEAARELVCSLDPVLLDVEIEWTAVRSAHRRLR